MSRKGFKRRKEAQPRWHWTNSLKISNDKLFSMYLTRLATTKPKLPGTSFRAMRYRLKKPSLE